MRIAWKVETITRNRQLCTAGSLKNISSFWSVCFRSIPCVSNHTQKTFPEIIFKPGDSNLLDADLWALITDKAIPTIVLGKKVLPLIPTKFQITGLFCQFWVQAKGRIPLEQSYILLPSLLSCLLRSTNLSSLPSVGSYWKATRSHQYSTIFQILPFISPNTTVSVCIVSLPQNSRYRLIKCFATV